MSKVAKLQIVPKYNQQTVDLLGELLEMAKAGEVVEMVYTAKQSDGSYVHGWTGCESLFELVGILERIKLATLRRMDGED